MTSDPIPWLILSNIPGLGPVGISTLLNHFKTPEQVLNTPQHHLQNISGIGPTLARAIAQQQKLKWAHNQKKKAKEKNITIITRADPSYPAHLQQIFAPPPVLFYRGNLELCNAPTIAIVGSRSFTPYGRHIAYQLAKDLADMGITVVSGLAIGTDTHAHKGALDQNGGTAAVLGSSIDHPYPPQNLALFEHVCERGVVISEFPLNTKPEAHNFPRRNRIISGLSLGTVVVEAGQRSGALITAQFALEQNREVFAVPGPINSGRSVGTNHLIQQGAQLVHRSEDVIAEIQRHLPNNRPQTKTRTPHVELNPQERLLWEHLSPHQACPINELARLITSTSAETLNILLAMELKGCVTQLPGMRFQRTA